MYKRFAKLFFSEQNPHLSDEDLRALYPDLASLKVADAGNISSTDSSTPPSPFQDTPPPKNTSKTNSTDDTALPDEPTEGGNSNTGSEGYGDLLYVQLMNHGLEVDFHRITEFSLDDLISLARRLEGVTLELGDLFETDRPQTGPVFGLAGTVFLLDEADVPDSAEGNLLQGVSSELPIASIAIGELSIDGIVLVTGGMPTELFNELDAFDGEDGIASLLGEGILATFNLDPESENFADYSIELFGGLVHGDGGAFDDLFFSDITYTLWITDIAGNTEQLSTIDLIGYIDDEPTLTPTVLGIVEEETLAIRTDNITGILPLDYGTDGPSRDMGNLTLTHFTIDNVSLEFGGDSAQITAVDNLFYTGTEPNSNFFTIVNTDEMAFWFDIDTITGNYTFELTNNLVHDSNEDIIRIRFDYTMEDADGDTRQSFFFVDVNDGGPIPDPTQHIFINEGETHNNVLSGDYGADGPMEAVEDRLFISARDIQAFFLDNEIDLTSGGEPISLSSEGGDPILTIFGRTPDNEVKFELEIDLTTKDFTLITNHLDHQRIDDFSSLTLFIPYTTVDQDGDEAEHLLTIDLLDSAPIANNIDVIETYTEGEERVIFNAELVSFPIDPIAADFAYFDVSVATDHMTAQGRDITFTSTHIGGGTWQILGDDGESTAIDLYFIPLTGEYNIRVLEGLTHTDDEPVRITLNYTATDYDGSTANGSVSIDILDGSPQNNDADIESVFESDLLTDNASYNFDLFMDFGPDGIAQDNSAFTLNVDTITLLDSDRNALGALTAGGDAVSFEYDDATDLLTASTEDEIIFTLDVDPIEQTYQFDLLRGIDHPTDDIILQMDFTLTDADGSTSLNTFEISISDSNLIQGGNTEVCIEEQNLPVGALAAGFIADGAIASDSPIVFGALNSFTVDLGDGVMSYDMTHPNITAGELSLDSLDGVFRLVVNFNDGFYEVTQLMAVDHTAGDAFALPEIIFNTDLIDFDSGMMTEDVLVTIAPVIKDATPISVEATVAYSDTLLYTPVVGALGTNPGPDVPSSGPTEVSLSITDDAGDLIADLRSAGELITHSSTPGLNSIFFSGHVGTEQIYSFQVYTDSMTYVYEQYQPLGHFVNDYDSEVINFNLHYNTLDQDGDSAVNTLTVAISDDVPEAGRTSTSNYDESIGGILTSQVARFEAGADGLDGELFPGIRMLEDDIKLFDPEGNEIPMSSGGETLNFNVLQNTTNNQYVITGYAGEDFVPENHVFQMVYDHDGDAVVAARTYTYEQFKPFDHPIDAGSVELEFGYILTDTDHDTDSGTFRVSISDALPVAESAAAAETYAEQELGTTITAALPNYAFGFDGMATDNFFDILTEFSVQTNAGMEIANNLTDNEDGTFTLEGVSEAGTAYRLNVNTNTNMYDFTLLDNLDHDGETTLSLPFTYTVTDADGSMANGTFSIDIIDDLGEPLGPVIFDLNNDGVILTDAHTNNIHIDADLDGTQESIGWVGAEDGILVYDADGNHAMTDVTEIELSRYHEDAHTDLAGLALGFDSNEDGLFNADDEAFEHFGIWQDSNQNGRTDAGEYQTLSNMGIVSIALVSDENGYWLNGNYVYGEASFMYEDGRTGVAADVSLTYYETNITLDDVLMNENDNVIADIEQNTLANVEAVTSDINTEVMAYAYNPSHELEDDISLGQTLPESIVV